MKTITVFLISLLPLLAVPAHADDTDPAEAIEHCTVISLIARDVMAARQVAQPMSTVLPEAIKRFEEWMVSLGFEPGPDTADAADAANKMVVHAYSISAYPSDGAPYEMKRNEEIAQFENEYFSECYTRLTSEEDEQ